MNDNEPPKKDNLDKDMFRKEALEKVTVPDELNLPFIPVTYRRNLIWLTLGIFVFFLMAWILLGTVPILIEGRGIVMDRKGLFSIQAKTGGIIKEIVVVPGQTVQKDQLLMVLSDPELEKKYDASLIKIKSLEEDVSKLRAQIQFELQAQKESIQQQIIGTQASLKQLEVNIGELEKELSKKEALYKQHLLGLNQLYEARQTLSQNKIELETTKGTLAKLEANLNRSYRDQELLRKEHDLLQARQESDLLKLSFQDLAIKSTQEGVVLEILAEIGGRVFAGNALVRLEYGAGKLQSYIVYAYIPTAFGKRIQPDMPVEVELSNVRVEEYGAIMGKVVQISPYPVSRDNIGKIIQNEGLADYLMGNNKAVVQIIIEPELDPTTPSGYKWTSGKGPAIKLSIGTVCLVKGLAGRESVIFHLISLWRLEKWESDLIDQKN